MHARTLQGLRAGQIVAKRRSQGPMPFMALEEGICLGRVAPRSWSKATEGPSGLKSLRQVIAVGPAARAAINAADGIVAQGNEQAVGLLVCGGQGGHSTLAPPSAVRPVVSS